MNDTDDIGSNQSGNPHLVEIIASRLTRRNMLSGGIAAAAVGFLGGGCAYGEGAPDDEGAGTSGSSLHFKPKPWKPLLGFQEVPPSTEDTVVVPEGYTYEILIPWGTPLFRNSPPFAEDASNTAADQALQVGFNHDGKHYFPLGFGVFGNRRGLLVLNHEYTDANQIYTAAQGSAITPDEAGQEKVAKALAGHGVTVVEIAQGRDGKWTHVVGSRFNRRIMGTTPMAFSGPVSADHPMLASNITPAPLGTLNNCGNGFTPWGTYGGPTWPVKRIGTAISARRMPPGRGPIWRRATESPPPDSATTGTSPSPASTWQ
jgi:uncharacterized protein